MSYRQSILDSALTLFANKGFAATTVAEVAELTGAAEGTIFHHFKSKDGLFLAVLESIREDFVSAVREVGGDRNVGTGLDLLGAVVGLFFLMSETKPREFKLLLRSHAHEYASENPKARAHLEAIYETFASALTEAISLGVEDGSIRPVRPERQAMLILSMLTGVVRFNTFGLWSSSRSYRDARELICRALDTHGDRAEER